MKTLEDWKIKIAVLWGVWEFAAIMIPLNEQYIPGLLEQAMADITPAMLLLLAIVMLIAPFMAFLTLTLKNSVNRWTNIIVGIVFVGLGIFGVIGSFADPTYRDYYVFAIPIGIVEVAAAAFIVWNAWKSKQKT